MADRKDYSRSFRFFRAKTKYEKSFSNTSIKQLTKALNEAVKDLGQEFLQDMADALLADAQSRLAGDKHLENSTDPDGGAFDTGRLHASGDWKRLNDTSVEVGFVAPYAPDVEFGLDPSQVTVTLEEIESWARRKRFPDPKRVAFFVHRNLHRKGSKPKPFLRMATAYAKANVDFIAHKTEKRLKLK